MKKQLWLGSAFLVLAALVLVGQWPTFANGPAAESLSSPKSIVVPGWQQSNSSGFGTADNNMIGALEVFNGQMYAATWNESGAQVWRTDDGLDWTQFTPGTPFTTTVIYDMKLFGSNLYIGTYLDTGAEIWRTNGTTRERVAEAGLGDANNVTFSAFGVYSGTLYVATGNLVSGVEIWRSPTGNADSWTQANLDGFSAGASWDSIVMEPYGGYLYIGIGRVVGGSGSKAELWRTNNGTTWDPVFTDGLGSAQNTVVSAMAEYHGDLYVGLRNVTTGGQIWSSTNGTTFTSITTDGFGNSKNARPYGLYGFENALYIVFSNYITGAEVWRIDGTGSRAPVIQGGWGDSNSINADYLDKAAVGFNGSLYIGNGNDITGGQIWQMLRVVYLPAIHR